MIIFCGNFSLFTFRDIMPLFQVPHAVNAVVDLMTAFIELSFSDVEAIAGMNVLKNRCYR